MGNVRNRLALLLTVVIVGAGAGMYAVFPDASWSAQPIVTGAAFLAIWLVSILGVVAMTLSPDKRVLELSEALRAISIGQPSTRLDAERFGGLENIAIACNELASVLSEGKDPNLGAVKRRARPGSEKPRPPKPTKETDADGREIVEHSQHPELGAVKKLKRTPAEEPAPKKPIYEAPSFDDAKSVDDDQSGSAEAGENDTVIDSASPPEESSSTIADATPPDPGQELRDLFERYTAALAETGADGDLDFDEFKTTIEAEKNALIEAHGCKSIRFEIRVQDDDVSLLPHLVR